MKQAIISLILAIATYFLARFSEKKNGGFIRGFFVVVFSSICMMSASVFVMTIFGCEPIKSECHTNYDSRGAYRECD
jgi:hypothetical protein